MPKAPRLTAKQASLLRADLAQSGWGVESVEALLGPVAAAALQRELRAPALRVVRRALAAGDGAASTSSDRPSLATGVDSTSSAANAPQDSDVAGYKVAVLTALFMLGEPVGAAALETALWRGRSPHYWPGGAHAKRQRRATLRPRRRPAPPRS